MIGFIGLICLIGHIGPISTPAQAQQQDKTRLLLILDCSNSMWDHWQSNSKIKVTQQVLLSFLDSISPEAQAIGAVNVIRIKHEGRKVKLKGFNSDVIGFTQSIEPMLDKKWHQKALVLGTGGASKAITYGLKSLGIEPVYVSRYQRPGTIQYEQITPEVVKEYNVIVNCTPLGMYPHVEECPLLPYEAMDSHTILYDLIYNPDETLFMKKGRKQGADVKNGLEMLLLQAFASWEIWNGK